MYIFTYQQSTVAAMKVVKAGCKNKLIKNTTKSLKVKQHKLMWMQFKIL